MIINFLASTLYSLSGIAIGQTVESNLTDPVGNSSAASIVQPNEQPTHGAIIMYRGSSVVGAALGCPIRYKTRQVVELGRGKFAEWPVPPGRYILVNGTASVEVNVASNEKRYVRCQIKPGFLTGRADLQIVDEEDFAKHRQEYEQKEVTSPF